MMHPLVSIIIPNYNKEKHVARCLDSLLGQSYSNIEIIYIDDCSTDRSLEIVKSYEGRLDQLKIIENPVNMGASISRNIGLIKASGKYVTTLDSDDEYLPSKIENEVRTLEEKVTSEFVAYSDIIARYKDKDLLLSPKIGPDDNALKLVLFRERAVPTFFMFHRTSFEYPEYGFDRTLQKYEDWDVLLRMLNHAKFVCSGEPGAIYHQQNTGLSRGSILDHIYWISVVFLKNYKTSSLVKRLYGLCRVFMSLVQKKLG